MEKEQIAKNNWRAHVNKFVRIRKKKQGDYLPEQYCETEGVNCKTFQVWLEFMKREDEVAFYHSFASMRLTESKTSLELLRKNIGWPRLRMPLMRDAIVAYGSLFHSNQRRTSRKGFNLKNEIEPLIPDHLAETHNEILKHRDTVVAHCDLGVKNPRVCTFGVGFRVAGCRWEDYQRLMPDFEKLIFEVHQQLNEINGKKDLYAKFIQDYQNHPDCWLEDPGPPKTDG